MIAAIVLVLALAAAPALGAELQPATVAAFDRYVALTEGRLDAGPFLWLDTLPSEQRSRRLDELRRGLVVIERLTTRDGGKGIDVPDGLIHHWLGVAFLPGASLDRVLALLQDYDRHAEVYRPRVARSRLLARDGDAFRAFLRFRMEKVITVVVNSEHDARFRRIGADRADGRVRSTRIAEVDDPDTPREREKPVGSNSGYLWRLNTYWRMLEADAGVYLQCESVTLTRGIPFALGWIIRPFVTSIPRESLVFTLETTRKALAS